MKNYNYQDLIEECENFSKWRLNRNLLFIRIVLLSLNPTGLLIWDMMLWIAIWSVIFIADLVELSFVTVIMFFIIHFLYWEFFGKKNAQNFIDDIDINNVKLSLKALKETKNKKFGKNG